MSYKGNNFNRENEFEPTMGREIVSSVKLLRRVKRKERPFV